MQKENVSDAQSTHNEIDLEIAAIAGILQYFALNAQKRTHNVFILANSKGSRAILFGPAIVTDRRHGVGVDPHAIFYISSSKSAVVDLK